MTTRALDEDVEVLCDCMATFEDHRKRIVSGMDFAKGELRCHGELSRDAKYFSQELLE